jgi:hypothetical protein
MAPIDELPNRVEMVIRCALIEMRDISLVDYFYGSNRMERELCSVELGNQIQRPVRRFPRPVLYKPS